jgi:hypothetical protein
MDLLEDFNFALSEDDVLRGEGADPAIVRTRKPTLIKVASAALHEGFALIHPVAFIHTANVVEHRHERILLQDGNVLTGPLVARHLAGAEQVTLAVCTIGQELEEFTSTWMGKDPLLGVALDGLGNAAVEILGEQVCERIGEKVQAAGLSASSPLSPGEPEWPVAIGQPQIFNLLDRSQTKVTLNSTGMMVPKKSISFVVGIGPEMVRTDLCAFCSLSEKCRYRHA